MKALVLGLVLAASVASAAAEAPADLPARLRETGLVEGDPQVVAFAPQYPLWSDGAGKRRWLSLPPGQAIDASDPDAWQFPVGTRLWKPVERAALGYLHANCAHCHHAGEGRVPVRLVLEQSAVAPAPSRAAVLRTTVDAPSRYRPPSAADDARVIVPGAAASSVLVARMQSRHARLQMPPLGTERPDDEGLALVCHWITHDLSTQKEKRP
jgi:hypothetical protein